MTGEELNQLLWDRDVLNVPIKLTAFVADGEGDEDNFEVELTPDMIYLSTQHVRIHLGAF